MTNSKVTSLNLTNKALSRLDAIKGPFSRSKAASIILEGDRIEGQIERIENSVSE
jgi:predicted DNA-binding protein